MDQSSLRIVFMGTPIIASCVLESLIQNGYQIVGVIAQPDREVGRKKIRRPVPTKEVALRYHIPVAQPEKIRLSYDFLYEWKPDLILTLAYGQIVPQAVLDIPRYGCLNLHGSLLPKYRGAAPIQYALIHHEKETGMTLMEMTAKMDAGKIWAVKKVAIDEEENATSLFQKMTHAAIALILEQLPHYIDGELVPLEQDEKNVTFAPTIKKEEEHLSCALSTQDFLGWVKALSEEPGGYVIVDGLKYKVLKAREYDQTCGEIGTWEILEKKRLLLQVLDGRIEVLEIQKEGKPRMAVASFLNGAPQFDQKKAM